MRRDSSDALQLGNAEIAPLLAFAVAVWSADHARKLLGTDAVVPIWR